MQIDSLCRCKICGREESVSFAHCLRHGWPKCHGQTMELVQQPADLDAAVAEAFGDVRAVRQALLDEFMNELESDDPKGMGL